MNFCQQRNIQVLILPFLQLAPHLKAVVPLVHLRMTLSLLNMRTLRASDRPQDYPLLQAPHLGPELSHELGEGGGPVRDGEVDQGGLSQQQAASREINLGIQSQSPGLCWLY